MRNYRSAFVFAVVGNIALIGILGGLWWRSAQHKETEAAMPSASSEGAQSVPNGSGSASTAPHETSLVPVQLSPERMQSIGVRIGRVERKMVGDEIRATGNVAVDETKLAFVQVRYSGYIQKVFADATYQYLRKGQPLFTIYSPDLAATEREYLVAKQNQQRVAGSTVPGVAESAASLLDAAAERLRQWGVPPREIARLESSGQVQPELQVDSPVSGYITERNALPNLTVQPETRLYSVADLSTVWIFAEVFQNDLGRIKVGDTLVHRRKEMKHGAVVPHIAGVGRELAVDNVRRDPLNSFRSRTQTLFGYVDGGLGNIKDGDVLISVGKEVIH
jgi:Cu(I)/Ag(I) efflux system membrane fusion protein/cobalt-zinc-cadmium efflux system membrane fusion protein